MTVGFLRLRRQGVRASGQFNEGEATHADAGDEDGGGGRSSIRSWA
jgi:hypothetical protein